MNTHFRLCCLAALLAPPTDGSIDVPIREVATEIPTIGRLSVAALVFHSPIGGLLLEVNVRLRHDERIYRESRVQRISPEMFRRGDLRTPFERAVSPLRGDFWKWALARNDALAFSNFDDLKGWVESLEAAVSTCCELVAQGAEPTTEQWLALGAYLPPDALKDETVFSLCLTEIIPGVSVKNLRAVFNK